MKISVPPSKIMKEYFFLPLLPPPPRYRFRPFLLFKKEGKPPTAFTKRGGGGGGGRTLFQVNETNSVKYIYIYIKFSMYKINFIVTIKVCVYYLYFWIMKISVPPSKIMKEYFFLPTSSSPS